MSEDRPLLGLVGRANEPHLTVRAVSGEGIPQVTTVWRGQPLLAPDEGVIDQSAVAPRRGDQHGVRGAIGAAAPSVTTWAMKVRCAARASGAGRQTTGAKSTSGARRSASRSMIQSRSPLSLGLRSSSDAIPGMPCRWAERTGA